MLQQASGLARAAMQPAVALRLPRTDGGMDVLLDLDGRPLGGWRRSRWALWGVKRWPAAEVPEDLVLRRQWWQPMADEASTAAAVMLRGRTESPFSPEDTVFVWCHTAARQGGVIHGVWISRALLQQRGWSDQNAQAVWVVLNPRDGSRYQVVPGPGWRILRRWRLGWSAVAGSLWLVALILAAAAALTPSWQLRERAHDAQQRWSALASRAEPALAARQMLTQALQAVQAFDQAAARHPDPVAVLNWLHERSADDTHVTELELDGEVLRISGLTANAVTLQQQWAAAPGVASVVATRAATRSQAHARESFQFELRFSSTPTLAQP